MDTNKSFSEYLADQDRAAATIRNYLADIKSFGEWFEDQHGEPLSPTDLTPTDIRLYRQHMIADLAPATINRRLAAIRAYAAWGIDSGQIDYNPAKNVQGISEQDHGPKWLDRKQQAALMREAERGLFTTGLGTTAQYDHARRNLAILTILLNTGLRVAELCGLVGSDVRVGERSGEIRVRSGKGQKARSIPLNKITRNVLHDWLGFPPDPGRVFSLAPRQVERMVAEIGRRAGVEVTPHTLRHTFAKNLVDNGIGLEKIAALLGHSSLETTRIYITPGQADLERAVSTLE